MHVEGKGCLLDGEKARVGWVEFSKTGRTVFYRGRSFKSIGGRGVSGNFIDEETGFEFWISGIKARGSNGHPSERRTSIAVDEDAKAEYERVKRTQ